ncbi:hypothetical protein YC2023_043206 [Brassica napus]
MEIDVKRLPTNSGQGTVAFKNEVKLRNLMRILRCCVELEENIDFNFFPYCQLDVEHRPFGLAKSDIHNPRERKREGFNRRGYES